MSGSSARTAAALRGRRHGWLGALGLGVAALTAATSGCGDIGDAQYVPASPVALNQVDLDNKPFCVGSCAPDYGSTRIDCDAEKGLEFFPVDVMNGDTGTVLGFYAYNDGSSDFMVAGPLKFDGSAVTTNDPASNGVSNYEPETVTVNDRCGEDGKPGPNNVHHLRGGLFTEYGGGMGSRLQNFATREPLLCNGIQGAALTDPEGCPDLDERIESVADLPSNMGSNLRANFYGMTADLRGWEGISFWARQGPDNSAGIRVYVGDRQLDDDIAFIERNAGLTPSCLRARECGCRNHKPCTADTLQRADAHVEYSCWDPQLDVPPSILQKQSSAGVTFINPYDICGTSQCDAVNSAWGTVEPLFATPDRPTNPGTAQCQLFKLTNDLETYYCYDKDNPASYPPDGPQQCGDGWAKGVALSTDWKFYTVPFTELRQEGYGQKFSHLDLSKITLVRFTWMQGWLDVWLDDVRFYRHARGVQQIP
jgi:hypothetical protein